MADVCRGIALDRRRNNAFYGQMPKHSFHIVHQNQRHFSNFPTNRITSMRCEAISRLHCAHRDAVMNIVVLRHEIAIAVAFIVIVGAAAAIVWCRRLPHTQHVRSMRNFSPIQLTFDGFIENAIMILAIAIIINN